MLAVATTCLYTTQRPTLAVALVRGETLAYTNYAVVECILKFTFGNTLGTLFKKNVIYAVLVV